MIETEQTVRVHRSIDETWAYAKDFERWASIMPGYQTCEIEDADNSRWILKVGVGALVRTVKVRVHVDNWAGPEGVDFTFELEGDPVTGTGTYRAAATDGGETDMTLHVQVKGGGSMAPMWEAMGGPVLPKFARGFAEQLRDRIEASGRQTSPQTVAAAKPSALARLRARLSALWNTLRGRN